MEPILCFVKGDWAYFTTQPLAEQWGDDWNDVPYEHNAGDPYRYRAESKNAGSPYEVIQVAWWGPLCDPASRSHALNSPYSVEMINAGQVAWLATDEWHQGPPVAIMAGTPLSEFIRLVQSAGGSVYQEVANGYSS